MRVLVVCSYRDYIKDGIAPFIKEQVNALCALTAKSEDLRGKSRERRAENYEVKCEYYLLHGKGIKGYLKEIPALRKKIREYKPDVIHAHYGLTCLVANLATRRVPVVSTYHGSDINKPKVLPFSKVAMWLSAWNIFVSKRNMVLVGAVEGKKCSLIPCGINLPMLWSELQNQKVEQLTLNQWVETVLPKGKKHVLFAGAFDNDVKDPELATAAVAAVNSEKLRDSSEELELIELKGYNRDQVNALMYNCDAFLLTSKTEGSPQVIKEAMTCGCPIVSVDVGDVAERTEGVEGCFVVPSREPNDIAEALKKAIAFKGRTKGRERIIEMRLANEQVAKRIIKIYEQILNV